MISKALKAEGFVPCSHDQCFLVKPGIFLILYVDDVGICAKNPKDIEKLIASLRSQGFELTEEGTFTEFLGIKFAKNEKDGTIELTQQGLIDKIITAAGMENCHPNHTPASLTPLGSDPEGAPMDEKWSYSSVIGMLLYLTIHTRPDISFAVSQVARFSSNPKHSHVTAIKMIIRYLKGTRTRGIIMKPTGKLDLSCYVDADFAGLFKSEPDDHPQAAKSRTGYIVFLDNCPWLWKCPLQTNTALSTCESETNAMATLFRTLVPVRAQLIEVAQLLGLPEYANGTTGTTVVWEDNAAALALAVNRKITSRTRYYLVKIHFIWEQLACGGISVEKIVTALQRANYLTKALPRESFERERRMSQGW
jgi:Reverse transcriptase (RNA-dependent DNA polymerase)